MQVPHKLLLTLVDTSLPHSKADVKVFHEKHEVLPGSEPITARSCEQMKAIIQAELPVARPNVCSNRASCLPQPRLNSRGDVVAFFGICAGRYFAVRTDEEARPILPRTSPLTLKHSMAAAGHLPCCCTHWAWRQVILPG